MTSFVHTHYPDEHPGMARATQVVQGVKALTGRFDGTRGLAALLLAAVVSAMLVVANQVIDTWTDGHLLAGWIALWVIAFVGLALMTLPTRRLAQGLQQTLRAWSQRRKQARADEQLWELALGDARVMADISRAMTTDAARDVRGYD